MNSTDYHWLLLLLCALLCSSCATIHGSGDTVATSRPVCLSRSEWREIRDAQKKCLRERTECKESTREALERVDIGHRTALRLCANRVMLCRSERDDALRRRCPKQKCAATWPRDVLIGVLGIGVVVLGGVLVVLGW